MIVGEVDENLFFGFSRKDLADLDQGLARNDQLLVADFILQFHLPDGDPVSVQGCHPQAVFADLKQFPAHQSVAVIVGDGKDRLTDHFLQGELGQNDGIVPFDFRKIGKIFSGFSDDVEFGLFTGDGGLEAGVRRDGDIIVRKLSDDIQEYLCVKGNDPFFQDLSVDDGFDPQFHIIGGQTDPSVGGVDQDAFQDGHGGFIGNGLGYHLQTVQQCCLGAD